MCQVCSWEEVVECWCVTALPVVFQRVRSAYHVVSSIELKYVTSIWVWLVYWSEILHLATRIVQGPVHTNPFSNKNGAVLFRFQKDLLPHLSFSNRFHPSTLQPRIRFENAVILSVRMLEWTRRMCISIYRLAKLARNWSHMVASVRHFGYSRSSGLAPCRVYFDDVTAFR